MFERRAETATDPISRQHYKEMAAHYRALAAEHIEVHRASRRMQTGYRRYVSCLLPMLRDARVARSSMRLLCFNKLDLILRSLRSKCLEGWPQYRSGDFGTRAFSSEVDPVRVKKTRQTRNLEPRFDSIETEKALEGAALTFRI